jgi:hypothetical protein
MDRVSVVQVNTCGSVFHDSALTPCPENLILWCAALAMNVGQYHTVDNGDLSKTMKVILTINNDRTDTNVKFLSYFSTTFNQEVAPGDFVWPPFTEPDTVSAQRAPWRSMQIFSEYLDDESMLAKFEQIPDTSSLTTAVYQATTIENAAFGVKAGQKVEILLLQINSDIPTNLFVKSNVDRYSVPLADLATEIMNSEELVAQIFSFLAM